MLSQQLKKAPPVAEAEIAKQILDLDSPVFSTRDAASRN